LAAIRDFNRCPLWELIPLKFTSELIVDTDADIRLMRRMERDIKERGRTFDGVRDQYLATVYPMHFQFVEPSKVYADVVIPRGGENKTAINMVVYNLKHMIINGVSAA